MRNYFEDPFDVKGLILLSEVGVYRNLPGETFEHVSVLVVLVRPDFDRTVFGKNVRPDNISCQKPIS